MRPIRVALVGTILLLASTASGQVLDIGCCDTQTGACVNLSPSACTGQGGASLDRLCLPEEACCLEHGPCIAADPGCCLVLQGVTTPQGPGSVCSVDDDVACCIAGSCTDLDTLCCDEAGGVRTSGAFSCDTDVVCCDASNFCTLNDAECCEIEGNTPHLGDSSCDLEACCILDSQSGETTCIDTDGTCCPGISSGPGTQCSLPEACCDGTLNCEEIDATCCTGARSPLGTGTTCSPPSLCCFDDGSAEGDPSCCIADGGIPIAAPGPPAFEACCFDDGGCTLMDPRCCELFEGQSRGPGSTCQGDGNGNGIDDGCEPPIPMLHDWGYTIVALVLLALGSIAASRRWGRPWARSSTRGS